MMEAARTSETFVDFYQTTRRYNPEESIFGLTAVRTSNPTDGGRLEEVDNEKYRDLCPSFIY
jgi:hypothetical protein